MNRVKSREYLLQLAYQMEITSETALETFNLLKNLTFPYFLLFLIILILCMLDLNHP